MDLLRHFEQEQVKDVKRPRLRVGDIVRVETKIEEEEKTRLQTFEGTILMVRGSGPSTTFTVRRETSGFGVERIFALYSPLITNIDIVKRQKVRRAKLSYLRQAGRRRFKEDVKAMQRLIKERADAQAQEEKKKKLAEEEKQEEVKQAAEKQEEGSSDDKQAKEEIKNAASDEDKAEKKAEGDVDTKKESPEKEG